MQQYNCSNMVLTVFRFTSTCSPVPITAAWLFEYVCSCHSCVHAYNILCVCICVRACVRVCVRACVCVMHMHISFIKQSRLTRLGEIRGISQDGCQQYVSQHSRQWSKVCNDCSLLSDSSHQYVG